MPFTKELDFQDFTPSDYVSSAYCFHLFLSYFSPMVSGWAGGRWEKVCPGCISETVRCRKLILGSDIG